MLEVNIDGELIVIKNFECYTIEGVGFDDYYRIPYFKTEIKDEWQS